MKQRIIVLGICLLSLLLIPPQAGSAELPALAGSCSINWHDKVHNFTTPKRFYSFKGEVLMSYANRYYYYTAWVLFDVTAEYDVTSHSWKETAFIRKPVLMNRGGEGIKIATAERIDEYTHTRSGWAADDPWIGEFLKPFQITVVSDQGGVTSKRCFINHDDSPMVPCPLPWSSCVYTEAEKAALREEFVKLGTCTREKAQRAPTLALGFEEMWKQSEGHFSSPGEASIILMVDCLPCSLRPEGNDFFIEAEKKKWDENAYGFRWTSIRIKPNPVKMHFNESKNKALAALNLGLSEIGTYRVRAQSRISIKEDVAAGPQSILSEHSPWVTLTAGDLKMEIFHPGHLAIPGGGDAGSGARPDLVISENYAHPEPADPSTYTIAWLVQNKGNKKSPPADVILCCVGEGGSGNCPDAFLNGGITHPPDGHCLFSGETPELYPNKPEGLAGQPGGGQWFWVFPMVLPPEGVRYRLTAIVDSSRMVDEGVNEGNNKLVIFFPPSDLPRKGVAPDTRKPPGSGLPGQERQLALKKDDVVGVDQTPLIPQTPTSPAVIVRSISESIRSGPRPVRSSKSISSSLTKERDQPAQTRNTLPPALPRAVVPWSGTLVPILLKR